MKKNTIKTMLNGLIVGSTMLVPGVSGGSMAMLLGIYDRLVHSISSFTKNMKENFLFLVLFSIGGLLGMILFASPLLRLIELYTMPMLYLFIGIVAGGVPMMYEKSGVKKIDLDSFLYFMLGFVSIFLVSALPSDLFPKQTNLSGIGLVFLIMAGFTAAIALVLPGISVSYMLLLMGIYEETMKAVSRLYLPYLIPLGIGVFLGIILTTKLLEQAMQQHPKATYLVILGFVIGSIAEVFPGIPTRSELLICFLTLIAGFLCIHFISKLQKI